jgi:hypothetical protein
LRFGNVSLPSSCETKHPQIRDAGVPWFGLVLEFFEPCGSQPRRLARSVTLSGNREAMNVLQNLHGDVALGLLTGLLCVEEVGVPLPFAPGELTLLAALPRQFCSTLRCRSPERSGARGTRSEVAPVIGQL